MAFRNERARTTPGQTPSFQGPLFGGYKKLPRIRLFQAPPAARWTAHGYAVHGRSPNKCQVGPQWSFHLARGGGVARSVLSQLTPLGAFIIGFIILTRCQSLTISDIHPLALKFHMAHGKACRSRALQLGRNMTVHYL